MRAARYVPTSWNIDARFVALSSDTRLLLFGLWTWPETPTSGLTITDPARIAKAIGITPRRTVHCLAELENAGHIEVDPDSAVVWLRGFWEVQVGSLPNASHRAATRSQIRALPDTAMLRRYRAEYGLDNDLAEEEGGRRGGGRSANLGDDQALPSCPLPLPSHPVAGKKGRLANNSAGRKT
jgi:hypothetical protein